MEKILHPPRPGYARLVEEKGLLWHQDYYTEDCSYAFRMSEILRLERATQAILQMCVGAMNSIIGSDAQLRRFRFPERYHGLIRESWNRDFVSLYGRLDLGYNPNTGEIKLFEFNADTPTALLEASIIQYDWLTAQHPGRDQFNSIHEKLINHLKAMRAQGFLSPHITCCCIQEMPEDYLTTKYLEDCFAQAGYRTDFKDMSALSVDTRSGSFEVEGDIFKLYPWEWMMHEQFGEYLLTDRATQWIEPMYKAIWSNKMFMVILAELYPHSPYLLKAWENRPAAGRYVAKPLLSREGANVTIFDGDRVLAQTAGEYGKEGFIYQEYFEVPQFDGYTPVLGSWVIGGEPAGIGIRESRGLITDNKSKFVNHYIH